jgi:hypothetical protein
MPDTAPGPQSSLSLPACTMRDVDIDRYTISGQYRQVELAGRLRPPEPGSATPPFLGALAGTNPPAGRW